MRRLAASVLLLSLVTPCLADPGTAAGLWLDVPYVRQPKNGCGAACIAMVVEYWRRRDARFHATAPDVGTIERALYSPAAHGIRATSMEDYLRGQGLRVFAFRGDWDLLRTHLSQGRPLIVCLREGKTLHYVVIAGIDPAQAVVLVNDPASRKLAPLSRSVFETKWSGRGDWTLLAVPPSHE